MIARLLISPSIDKRGEKLKKILEEAGVNNPHPDLLIFPAGSKLGIEQARKIKGHFMLKPFQAKGRVVALEEASVLTVEAQNALLKTIEELPPNSLLILAASSGYAFLPTILSRCQIIRIKNEEITIKNEENIEKLLTNNIIERFRYIEELKDRKEFLQNLLAYFHHHILQYPGFIKELLQAEEWAAHNVNIRAILEYLMLKMPSAKNL